MSTEPASATARAGTPADRGESLASAACGVRLRVVALVLEPSEAAWLSAVGVAVGEVLVVLRHAPFGGPLHVACEIGGELAIGPSLAKGILVEAAP